MSKKQGTGNVIKMFRNHNTSEVLENLNFKDKEKGIRSIAVVYCMDSSPAECISEVHVGSDVDCTALLGAMDYNKSKVLERLTQIVEG